MVAKTPAERAAIARIASHESWARTPDRTARTRPAREAADQRFLDQVDPGRVLPEEERARRAAHARSAYFARLQLKAAKARRLRAEAAQLEAEAQAEATS